MLRVVVFTGGRGSTVLSQRLLRQPSVQLILAVNGYDDGASTGEVRRFLGDALGPSDFRKNASRVAEATSSCSAGLIRLLDSRLPADIDPAVAARWLTDLLGDGGLLGDGDADARAAAKDLAPSERDRLAEPLDCFLREWKTSGRGFNFSDCAVGNLVFAGCFLRRQRKFNSALDDYTALVGLAPGVVDNVTDGTNAHLVALDSRGQVLGTEEAIVDTRRATQIEDIFLIDRPLDRAECESLAARGAAAARRCLESRSVRMGLNERVAARIDEADVIIYAPGTQYSSLFPSYLTPGLSNRIAGNLRAVKVLITNLESDAEIAGASAVTLVERALYYLTDKGTRPRPVPCLITHYLLNDPSHREPLRPYVPLGQVDSFADPRLVRIGYYEEGVTGRHDAAKVLEPFIESRLDPSEGPRIGALLYGTASANKIAQTLLEIVRGGHETIVRLTVFAAVPAGLDKDFLERLPFDVELYSTEAEAQGALSEAAAQRQIDFVALFDSSGMYRGDDLAGLFRYVASGRLEAVWGSRRLSLRDIEESYRYHFFRNPVLRSISRAGSYLLSAAYLGLYGRYVADTLSGVRVVPAREIEGLPVPLTHALANQHLLSRLLGRRADLLEVPVQFIPLSTERARRTGIGDGVRSLATIVRQRFRHSARKAGARP